VDQATVLLTSSEQSLEHMALEVIKTIYNTITMAKDEEKSMRLMAAEKKRNKIR
jgi:hypothetical protein